jgi:uncharacterized protein
MFGPSLGEHRRTLVTALASLDGGDDRLLGVRGDHLERARSANRELIGAPTLPAGERYTGVVWDHLGLATLPRAARRRASASIVVVSGLLGVVGVDDPVPDYRLKMGARLPAHGGLATWWRPRLSPVLDEWVRGRLVIDLLPNEHRSAWGPAARGPASPSKSATVLEVAFRDASGRAIGHDAKAAKGELVRHLLLDEGDPEQFLRTWRHDRFTLDITSPGR